MASKEINLLQLDTSVSPEIRKWKGYVLKFVIPFVFFFIGFTIIVLSIDLYLNSQISGLKSQIDTTLASIKSQEKNEITYMVLKQKATAIASIVGGRFPFIELYNYFKSINDKNGSISSLNLSENGEVVVNVTIPNTESLDSFIKTITADAEKRFKRIQIGGISYKPGGNYVIGFTIDALNKITK